MYVHDMGQTKGHIAALACARWHPQDRAQCLTAAIDGTVRLWDVTMCDKKQVTVLKAKNTRGQKTIPHAATYRPNGDVIAACDDGTIKARRPPSAVTRHPQTPGIRLAGGGWQDARHHTRHPPSAIKTPGMRRPDCATSVSVGGCSGGEPVPPPRCTAAARRMLLPPWKSRPA